MKMIQDIVDLSRKEIEDGANFYDVETEECRIEGEIYPMFYAKIINKYINNEMPFILFLGKPGSSKTWSASKLGSELNKFDIFDGEFNFENSIYYKNIEFMEELLDSQNKILLKPDINATLKSIDHHEDENRAFENFLHLSRIFGNLIIGDAQYLWRCDTGIQITHTFRFVATSDASEYAFDIYYIDRKADSEKKDVDPQFIQRWYPDKPDKELRNKIKKKDKKEKYKILEDELAKAKGEDKKEDGLKGIDAI